MSDNALLPHVRLIARFTGRVQNVGFRATVLHHSDGLEVHGTVANEVDGSVVLDVDGDKRELQELLQRIESRPAGRLENTRVTWSTSLNRNSGLSIG